MQIFFFLNLKMYICYHQHGLISFIKIEILIKINKKLYIRLKLDKMVIYKRDKVQGGSIK